MGTLTQTRVRPFTCFRGLEYGLFKLISEIYMQAVGILQCRLDDEYIMCVQMNYA
jgi:hypothetical protein